MLVQVGCFRPWQAKLWGCTRSSGNWDFSSANKQWWQWIFIRRVLHLTLGGESAENNDLLPAKDHQTAAEVWKKIVCILTFLLSILTLPANHPLQAKKWPRKIPGPEREDKVDFATITCGLNHERERYCAFYLKLFLRKSTQVAQDLRKWGFFSVPL